MSQTIDERVVDLQFNNKQFESGAKDSISTLNKLNDTLKLQGATSGLENVATATRKLDFSPLSSAVETVSLRFSALQIAGITAISNITNSAVNAGKKMISALTIDPIKTGFSEYETQINSVQTILANTAKEGTNLATVNAALDELNTYADKTIYNFTEMTRNIGTFTAAGVELDTSVQAIKGIANLAAVSGSNAQQASTAMYQLSQAMASGTVKLMDWNSVVNAGMGGQVFQDALKETARVSGISIDSMIDKYGSFRETLQTGWLTTEVLTDTLAKFTGDLTEAQLAEMGYTEDQILEIIELGKMANGAATEVKTLTQLFDTLKEAAQSGWSQTWRTIIGDFEEAKLLFTEVSDVIGGMIGASADARNQLLIDGLGTGWDQFLSLGLDDVSSYSTIIDELGLEKIGEEYTELIKEHDTFQNAVSKGAISVADATDMMTEALQKYADENTDLTEEQIKAKGYTQEQVDSILALNESVKNGSVDIKTYVQSLTELSGRENLIDALRNSFYALLDVLKPIGDAWNNVFPDWTGPQLYDLTEKIRIFSEGLELSEDSANKIQRTFNGLFSVLNIIKNALSAVVTGVTSFSGEALNLVDVILTITATIGDWLTELDKTITENGLFATVIERITTTIKDLMSILQNDITIPGFEMVIAFFNKFVRTILGIKDDTTTVTQAIADTIETMGKRISESPFLTAIVFVFEMISNTLEYLAGVIKGVFEEITDNIKNSENIGLGEIFNFAALGGIGILIKNFLSNFDDMGSIFENITGIFEELRGSLETFQSTLKAKTLTSIAVAIAILAGSLLVLSFIDSDKLLYSLGAITVLFGELMIALSLFSEITSDTKGIVKTVGLMIAISASIFILAGALALISTIDTDKIGISLLAIGALMAMMTTMTKQLGKDQKTIISGAAQMVIFAVALKILASVMVDISVLSWENMAKGLIGIGVMMGAISLFLNNTKFSNKAVSSAMGILILSGALKILASAMKDIAGMSWEELAKGLSGIVGLLASLILFSQFVDGGKNMMSIGIALVAIGISMKIFASAMKDIATLSWEDLGKSLLGLAGVLAALTIALNFLPKNMVSSGVGLIAVGAALYILSSALSNMGSMSWEELGRGLLALGGSLLILSIALYAMNGTLAGSAALAVAAMALYMLVPILIALGSMSLESIGKSLLFLAGGLAIITIAGYALTPVLPVLFGLAKVFLMIGTAMLLLGVGVGIMTGVTAAADAMTLTFAAMGLTIAGVIADIVGGFLKGLIMLIPNFVILIVDLLTALATALIQNAGIFMTAVGVFIGEFLDVVVLLLPKIFEVVKTFITGVLTLLIEMSPLFITTVFTLLNNLILGLITYIPILIDSAFKLMISFINGLATAIDDNHPLLLDAIGNLMSAMLNAVKETITSLWQVGVDMISGLIEGAKSMAQGIIDAVVGVVDGAISAAKNLLGINSPSRVFAEFGMFMDQGMANGLTKYSGLVSHATEDVGNKAISSMQKAMSTISDVMNSDMDTSPVIRPILDLTEVTNGMKTLDNTLSTNKAVSVSSQMNKTSVPTSTDSNSNSSGETTVFNQYNNSPKALSRIEIYRQTNNLISQAKAKGV